MKLKKIHWIGISLGLLGIIIATILIFSKIIEINLFLFLIGIAVVVLIAPFILEITLENKEEEQINEMFLEFSRNLAESVNTGTPVSKSIVNMSRKNYGTLTPYIQKLANQIEIGIPVHKALSNFAYDVNNTVIKRAVALIMEAERAGGEIDYILESVANSMSEVEKIKKERKSAIYGLVVQGYIIFFIFIGIMLVMQFKILPLTAGITSLGSIGGSLDVNTLTSSAGQTAAQPSISIDAISREFLYLILAQGFFAGLVIGKLGEGSLKAGIKHSFILAVAAFLISTGARIVFG